MREQLNMIREEAMKEIAACQSGELLQELKVSYLGKKGKVTAFLKGMKDAPPEERPLIGQAVNEIKEVINLAIDTKMKQLDAAFLQQRLHDEKIDVTLPGKRFPQGNLHILTTVVSQIEDIFLGMGYSIAEGPQVETDYYNFEALNVPKEHPAREMQDSFYFTENMLLRTQTSPVQVRTMEKMRPNLPVKVICPGVVYRRDDDATHSPMFSQVEGLYVDRNVTLGHLKGTLLSFARQMFGEDRQIRLRPSYFPFTEPSAEVDVSCFICGGAGCRLCKGTGWIEILGSGMVHPNVLRMSGYDPDEVSGFAFGMGIERIALLKYGISDIRLLFENDVRFLAQF